MSTYAILGDKPFTKVPDEVLDYTLKLGALVLVPPQPIDPVVSVEWSYVGPPGLIIGDGVNGAPAPVNSTTDVTVYLKDGDPGQLYIVTAAVTTAAARVFVRGFRIQVVAAV